MESDSWNVVIQLGILAAIGVIAVLVHVFTREDDPPELP